MILSFIAVSLFGLINFKLFRGIYSLFIALWAVILSFYFFGPISYINHYIDYYSFFYVIVIILAFTVSYVLSNLFSLRARFNDFQVDHKVFLNFGLIGVVFWLFGNLVFAFDYFISGDLYQLRLDYVSGAARPPILSGIGTILVSFGFFPLLYSIINKGYPFKWRLKMYLFLLALIPITMAGRQLYLQLILLGLSAYVMRSRYLRIMPAEAWQGNFRRLFKYGLTLLALLLMFVSILRFLGESAIFESKLDQYARTSGVRLRAEYLFLEEAPGLLTDFFVEIAYYFGGQLHKFIELMSVYSFDPIAFDWSSKIPFLSANLDKIYTLLGYVQTSDSKAFLISMPQSSWSMAYFENAKLFGYFGLVFFTFVSGLLSGLAQKGISRSNISFVNISFFSANFVVVVYSFMTSIFHEIYFVVFYALSITMFFRYNKLVCRF